MLTLLAQLVWGVGNVVDKYNLTKWIKQPMVALLGFGFFGAVASILVFVFRGFSHISIGLLILALALGLIYAIANYYYFTAIKAEEVSRVIPLFYLDPLVIAVLSAVFLGEVFSLAKYAGVVLLVLGAILISYKKSLGFKFSKGALVALTAMMFYAVYDLLLKFLVGRADPWTVFAYVRLGTFLSLLPLFFVYRRPVLALAKQAKGLAAVTLSNILGFLGILFFTLAISTGYVTLAASLSALQPLTVLLITVGLSILYPSFFKEEQNKKVFAQKLLAVILMIIGALLVT